jgi:hypothetical protein
VWRREPRGVFKELQPRVSDFCGSCHLFAATRPPHLHADDVAEKQGQHLSALASTTTAAACCRQEWRRSNHALRLEGDDGRADDVIFAARSGHPVLNELATLLLEVDAHIFKSRLQQQGRDVLGRRRPRDSARERRRGAKRLGERSSSDDVADAQAPAGAQYAKRLAVHRGLVW